MTPTLEMMKVRFREEKKIAQVILLGNCKIGKRLHSLIYEISPTGNSFFWFQKAFSAGFSRHTFLRRGVTLS